MGILFYAFFHEQYLKIVETSLLKIIHGVKYDKFGCVD